ncbi:MAG: S49 family peptidase [Azospirillum sp.]|nr:S49 family peptidase [Azospirillum sp.]
MRAYTHVISKVFGTPLMLSAGKAAQIVGALQQRFADGPGLSPSLPPAARRLGWEMNKAFPVTPHGVAVLTIEGTLVHKAMGAYPPSGFMTYPDIEADLRDAGADPRIKAILIDMDTPGGEATDSVFQLAAAVREVALVKPVWVVVDEQATSAGYLIASGATRILAPPSATTGSIGVIALHLDASAHEAEEGFKWTVVRAGARKADGNPYEPASPEFLADLQVSVDRLYARFVDVVAAHRGLSAAAVRATEAAVYEDSREALRLKLIDAIATPDEALAALHAEIVGRQFQTAPGAAAPGALAANPAAAAAPRKDDPMHTPDHSAAPPQPKAVAATEDEAPKKPEPGASDSSTCEQCGKQLAPAASAEATAAANAAQRKIGADAERARILAIQAHGRAMPGHDAVVAACVNDPALSADAAAARLLEAESGKRKKALDGALTEDVKLPAAAPAAEGAAPDANHLANAASKLVADAKAQGQSLSVVSAMARVLKGERG